VILAVALVHRLVIVAWTTTIATDSAYYLWAAEYFSQADYGEAMGIAAARAHPLYPLMISRLAPFTGGVETAGYGLSLFGSVIVIPFLYLLTRRYWNEPVACWTCMLYALHPIIGLDTSEILTEGVYVGTFVAAATCYLFARDTHRWWLYGCAGITGGIAFLIRSEGLSLLLFAGLCMCAHLASASRKKEGVGGDGVPSSEKSWGRHVIGTGVMVAAFATMGVSCLFWVRGAHGTSNAVFSAVAQPVIQSMRESLSPFLPALHPSSPAGEQEAESLRSPEVARSNGGIGRADGRRHRSGSLREILKAFIKSLYGPLVPLWILGLLFCRRWGGDWSRLRPILGLMILGWLPACMVEVMNPPASHRYFLSGTVFALPWAGAACAAMTEHIRLRCGGGAGGSFAIATLVIALVLLPRSIKPRRADEAAYPMAGRWVREHAIPGRRLVLASSEKLAFYAGHHVVRLSPTVREMEKSYRDTRAAYVMVDEAVLRKYPPDFLEALNSAGFECVTTFPSGGVDRPSPVRIYQLRRRIETDIDLIPDGNFSWWTGSAHDVAELQRVAFALRLQGRRGNFRVERVDTGGEYAVRIELMEPDPKEASVLQVGYVLDRVVDRPIPLKFQLEARAASPVRPETGIFLQDRIGSVWERSDAPIAGEAWTRYSVRHTLREGADEVLAGLYFAPRAAKDWIEIRNVQCWMESPDASK
jgi:hypothetical protein